MGGAAQLALCRMLRVPEGPGGCAALVQMRSARNFRDAAMPALPPDRGLKRHPP